MLVENASSNVCVKSWLSPFLHLPPSIPPPPNSSLILFCLLFSSASHSHTSQTEMYLAFVRPSAPTSLQHFDSSVLPQTPSQHNEIACCIAADVTRTHVTHDIKQPTRFLLEARKGARPMISLRVREGPLRRPRLDPRASSPRSPPGLAPAPPGRMLPGRAAQVGRAGRKQAAGRRERRMGWEGEGQSVG